MRVIAFLLAALTTASAAQAQTNVYQVERGIWVIFNSATTCRALNRPPVDFNYAPYNGLQIVARAKSSIGVEVFFWPGAVDPAREYELQLRFKPGEPLGLAAKPVGGDFMLSATDEAGKLWGLFQRADTLEVVVKGEPGLGLFFSLDDISWVLTHLQRCAGLLPPPPP